MVIDLSWLEPLVGPACRPDCFQDFWKERIGQLRRPISGENVEYDDIDHLSPSDWNALKLELLVLMECRSDRATAITLHAILDNRIRWAIEKSFIDELSNTDKAELFDGMNPLATYSARTRLAYALGLITKRSKGELLLLGKIRNKFAHEFTSISFSDTRIVQLCRNLSLTPNADEAIGPDQLKRYGFCCFANTLLFLMAGYNRFCENRPQWPTPPPSP